MPSAADPRYHMVSTRSCGKGVLAMAGNNATLERTARPFWDVDHLIGKVTKNERELIQVRHTEKDGRTYVDVRVFYPGSDGVFRPGKGIALPVQVAAEIGGLVLQAAETIRAAAKN